MKGLIVDIDDTLSETTKFWISVFQEKFGNQEGLSVDDMYRKYHYVQNVPYWKGQDVDSLIHKYINSNHFQMKLPMISNSNTVLSQIALEVPIICYLTKRPETVRKGTETWLLKYNFPKAPLLMKPKSIPDRDGNIWKAKFINTQMNKNVGIIDDDKNLVYLLERDKSTRYFLFGIENHNSPAINVYPCVTWDVLWEKYIIIKKEL